MRDWCMALTIVGGIIFATGCGDKKPGAGSAPSPVVDGDSDNAGGDNGTAGDNGMEGGDTAINGTPQVVITDPADGSFVLFASPNPAPTVDLQGTIADNATILAQNIAWTITAPDASTSSSQGNVNGVGLSVASTLAYTFDQLGAYVIALAYDDGERIGNDEITIQVVDNLPVEVDIRAPVDTDQDGVADLQPVESAQLTLSGRVREMDGDQVDTAAILWTVTAPDVTSTQDAGTTTCNGAGTTCTSTYAFNFAQTGIYSVRLEATDTQSRTVFAELDIVVVANTPPTCQILTPANGAAFASGETVTVSATVSDANEPALDLTVEWYFDDVTGAPAGTGRVDQLTATFPGAAACEAHTIVCVVTDSLSATGTDSVGFMVSSLPTITIDGIADDQGNNVRAAEGEFADSTQVTSISITTTTDDAEDRVAPGADMTLTVLDSHTGSALAAPATINPFVATQFTTVWDTAIGLGRHTLVAKITDSCGASAMVEDEVVVAPQMQTAQAVAGTDTWDVRDIFAVSGDAMYVAYRPDGGDNALAYATGVSSDPAGFGSMEDLTQLLDALSQGTRVRDIALIDDYIAFATSDGLIICPVEDRAGGNLSLAVQDLANPVECTLVPDYINPQGNNFADSETRALAVLPGGVLVAGTDNGVVFMTDPLGLPGQGLQCLEDTTIEDIAYDPISGALFIATNGDHAYRWDPTFDTCAMTQLDDNNTPMLGSDEVIHTVLVGSDGIWFGTESPSLLLYDVSNNAWTVYRPASSPMAPGSAVLHLAIEVKTLGTPGAGRDILWVALDAPANVAPSVLRRDEVLPSWTAFSADRDGIPDAQVRRITIDANGVKWLATAQGVAAYAWP